ncbi:MAG: hypothetical protein MJ204_10650 [Bacteroidales bacterium]|nr:hypothetical protein [Bacteroidales bacterium]
MKIVFFFFEFFTQKKCDFLGLKENYPDLRKKVMIFTIELCYLFELGIELFNMKKKQNFRNENLRDLESEYILLDKNPSKKEQEIDKNIYSRKISRIIISNIAEKVAKSTEYHYYPIFYIFFL